MRPSELKVKQSLF